MSALPPKADIRPRNRNVCFGPEANSCTAAKSVLFDHVIGESTRVFTAPIAHGTDDRAEIATLCGEDVLGPRGTHRIEAPLDDAILLKRPQTLR